ncbi:thiamine phosphate synthase [Pseudalkalibacillus decolorationis]|uniref:thiamine phosphate synthase n=1 Tax=Pseudalkalibacillus decolorationis TaxID=163879 RepID=UPI002148783C|nr:thiamine phosphate synthase [Pseudalkalibacillus decolorationis]
MGSVNCKKDPKEVLKEALDGGVTLFQFREKGTGSLQGEAKIKLAKELQGICRSYGVPFIVNDDIELALEIDADGIHVGQEDTPITVVRDRLGSRMILGVSAHDVDEAKIAVEAGVDYLGVGPMYATKTKADTRSVQGPQIIQMIRQEGLAIPIVGIGGIDRMNATTVVEAGADGVAVISAISQADSPRDAVEQLRKVISS